jgi:tetratricopeptide (TPR) repeat protein
LEQVAFGCSDYSNPYYSEGMPSYYTEPVLTAPVEPVQETATSALPPGVSADAVAKFEQARAAFFEGRYDDALKLTDAAVAQMPRDAVLHEFRSLVLFALQRYPESAAAIRPVLDVGPGWDWKTLSSLYPNADVYTNQLRALEAAYEKDRKAADVQFLLGYHYVTLGHLEAASRRLQASGAAPQGHVGGFVSRNACAARDSAHAPATAATPKAVPADTLTGSWTSTGPNSSSYSMKLQKDNTFTWSFSRGARR